MLILYLLLLMYMLYVHLMQMLNLCGAGRKSWKANFWQTRPRPGYGLTSRLRRDGRGQASRTPPGGNASL